jgi:hypothetical protein
MNFRGRPKALPFDDNICPAPRGFSAVKGKQVMKHLMFMFAALVGLVSVTSLPQVALAQPEPLITTGVLTHVDQSPQCLQIELVDAATSTLQWFGFAFPPNLTDDGLRNWFGEVLLPAAGMSEPDAVMEMIVAGAVGHVITAKPANPANPFPKITIGVPGSGDGSLCPVVRNAAGTPLNTSEAEFYFSGVFR